MNYLPLANLPLNISFDPSGYVPIPAIVAGAVASASAGYAAFKLYANKGRADGKWNTATFVDHYWSGGGQSANLGTIGLAEQFENHPSVQEAVQKAFERGIANNRTTKFTMDNGLESGFPNTNVEELSELFSIGNSTFFNRFMKCDGIECVGHFGIKDVFRDPLDMNRLIEGGVELPFSKEFPINHRFEMRFPMSGLNQCE
ncbi:MAG: hypothetical protein H3C47_15905 [Candidatus Cloacimonetes bacterium]|nr:hypothetical protein [Candidatus Cloacimonadota bacterium]